MNEKMREFIEYYVNLLIIQYHNKPKAQATIRAFLRPLAEVFQLFKDLEDAFNIETAVGVQLDIVAKYFGVKRTYNNIVFDALWHNYQYIDGYVDGLSFQTLRNKGDGGTWTLETRNKSVYNLTDAELRQLIKLRIIGLNNERITYDFFYYNLFYLFGSSVIAQAGTTMNVDFYFDASSNVGKVLDAYPDLFPVPAGVGATKNALPAQDKKFTLTKLQVNGGMEYNYNQGTINLVGNLTNSTLRLVH